VDLNHRPETSGYEDSGDQRIQNNFLVHGIGIPAVWRPNGIFRAADEFIHRDGLVADGRVCIRWLQENFWNFFRNYSGAFPKWQNY
jgi:hypothetical protein